MLIPQGLVMAAIYYFGFNFAIQKFNLMTPGREPLTDTDDGDAPQATIQTDDKDDKFSIQAKKIYVALGGADNLTAVDNCTTRLRLQLKDTDKIDEAAIKRSGAVGLNKLDKVNLHIIIGTEVQFVADALSKLFNAKTPLAELEEEATTKTQSPAETTSDSAIKSGVLNEFYSVADGTYMNIEDVNDSTFSQKMLGDGFAIEPTSGTITSPVDGTVTTVFPTKHAIGFTTDSGLEILLHMGIDTVELKGKPFDVKVSDGQHINHGDLVANVDLQAIKDAGKQTPMMVIITNMDAISLLKFKVLNNQVSPKTKILEATTK